MGNSQPLGTPASSAGAHSGENRALKLRVKKSNKVSVNGMEAGGRKKKPQTGKKELNVAGASHKGLVTEEEEEEATPVRQKNERVRKSEPPDSGLTGGEAKHGSRILATALMSRDMQDVVSRKSTKGASGGGSGGSQKPKSQLSSVDALPPLVDNGQIARETRNSRDGYEIRACKEDGQRLIELKSDSAKMDASSWSLGMKAGDQVASDIGNELQADPALDAMETAVEQTTMGRLSAKLPDSSKPAQLNKPRLEEEMKEKEEANHQEDNLMESRVKQARARPPAGLNRSSSMQTTSFISAGLLSRSSMMMMFHGSGVGGGQIAESLAEEANSLSIVKLQHRLHQVEDQRQRVKAWLDSQPLNEYSHIEVSIWSGLEHTNPDTLFGGPLLLNLHTVTMANSRGRERERNTSSSDA